VEKWSATMILGDVGLAALGFLNGKQIC